eukprot:13630528-Alexandrium_andersonii.AAC.1
MPVAKAFLTDKFSINDTYERRRPAGQPLMAIRAYRSCLGSLSKALLRSKVVAEKASCCRAASSS